MRVALDSSCWLEVFDGGVLGKAYRAHVAKPEGLLVPVITVYEVHQYLRRVKGLAAADSAASYMQKGEVVDIDTDLCLAASIIGLPLADSLIYATTRAHGATLWTQDAHFDGMPGVKYFAKT